MGGTLLSRWRLSLTIVGGRATATWISSMLLILLIYRSKGESRIFLDLLCLDLSSSLTCFICWDISGDVKFEWLPLVIGIDCWSSIDTPNEIVLHGDLIANFTLHIYILGLNAALVVDLRHEDLPGDCVLNWARCRLNWEQSFEFNAKGKSNKRIFDIML